MKRYAIALLLLCALFVNASSGWAASASGFRMDNLGELTCTRLTKVMEDSPDENASALFLWMAGWWSGVYDSAEYGGKRANRIAQIYLKLCPKGTGSARILDALRKQSPPADALKLSSQTAEDHIADGPEMRADFAYWLAGWKSARSGGRLVIDHAAVKELMDRFGVLCIEHIEKPVSELIRLQ